MNSHWLDSFLNFHSDIASLHLPRVYVHACNKYPKNSRVDMMQVQYSSRFFPTGFRTIRSTNYHDSLLSHALKMKHPNARTQFYPENKPFQKWCLQNILINLYRSLVPKWRSKALAENGVQKGHWVISYHQITVKYRGQYIYILWMLPQIMMVVLRVHNHPPRMHPFLLDHWHNFHRQLGSGCEPVVGGWGSCPAIGYQDLVWFAKQQSLFRVPIWKVAGLATTSCLLPDFGPTLVGLLSGGKECTLAICAFALFFIWCIVSFTTCIYILYIYITNPNVALLKAKSFKFTIHL